MGNRKKHVYSEEEHEFLLSFIPGHTSKEIIAEYNKRFSEPITSPRLKSYMSYHKIHPGLPYGYRKGNKPENTSHIGHEYIKDGYVMVKTEETPYGSNYKPKHRVLWEEANGPVPEGCILMFLDGNKQNCALENIELVTRKELGIMIRLNLRSEFAEITRSGILIARVIAAMEKRKEKKRRGKREEEKSRAAEGRGGNEASHVGGGSGRSE